MKSSQQLVQLIRIALNHGVNCTKVSSVNWEELLELAMRQGVLGLVYEALQSHPELIEISFDWKLEILGQTRKIEEEYKRHEAFIIEHNAFLKQNGIRMMILKGYGLSKLWPVPSHRPSGDVDIYEFGQWKEADKLVAAKYGVKIDASHHHHTVYVINGICVENHYDFINQYVKASSKKLEAEYKRLAREEEPEIITIYSDGTYSMNQTPSQGGHDGKIIEVEIIVPSPNLHALFLLRHHSYHFTSVELSFRMLLDWYFFKNTYGSKVDWKYIEHWCEEVGMKRFLGYLNEMCDILTVKSELSFSDQFAERMWDEIISPEFEDADKKLGLKYLSLLWRRWWRNRWKNKIVYKESLPSQLISLIHSHIINPEKL